jgi:hypothetical protein
VDRRLQHGKDVLMPPKKKLSKLAQHAKKDHGYPYDDIESLTHQHLEGWHKARHAADAEVENDQMKED